jgi:hypothetical protein
VPIEVTFMATKFRVFALALLAAGLAAGSAQAQAWVGLPGGLSTSLDYSWSFSDKFIYDYSTRSTAQDGDTTRSQIFVLGAEYTPISNLAVSARVPLVAARYTGRQAAFGLHGRYDDGGFNWTLQDFSLAARYQVLALPVAIAPRIAVSVPMTNYETNGWAAAGRGLKTLSLGASVGKFFTSGVPGLFVQGSYGYTFSERYKTNWEETADFNQDKSNINLMAGYFVLDELQVHLAADMQVARDGFEVSRWDDYTRGEQNYHDPLMKEDYLLIGGGASYSLRHDLRVSAMFRMWTWGNNTRNAHVVGMGLGWDVL